VGGLEPQGVGGLAAALLAAGCGYAAVRAEPPAGVERIAVGTFRVRSGPPVLGAWVAEAVAAELAATPGVSLASPSRADATVGGEVALAGDPALALAGTGAGPRGALADLQIRVRARLTTHDGAELRATDTLLARAIRELREEPAADEALGAGALRATAAEAGRRIVRALMTPVIRSPP
jgi:hypothetical protein